MHLSHDRLILSSHWHHVKLIQLCNCERHAAFFSPQQALSCHVLILLNEILTTSGLYGGSICLKASLVQLICLKKGCACKDKDYF